MEIKCTLEELNQLIGKEACGKKEQDDNQISCYESEPISDGSEGTFLGDDPSKEVSEMDKIVIDKKNQQKENEIVKKILTIFRDEKLSISQSVSLLQNVRQEILDFRLAELKKYQNHQ